MHVSSIDICVIEPVLPLTPVLLPTADATGGQDWADAPALAGFSGVKENPDPVVPAAVDVGDVNENLLATGFSGPVDCVGDVKVCGLNEKPPLEDAAPEEEAVGGVTAASADDVAFFAGEENEKLLPDALPPNKKAGLLEELLLLPSAEPDRLAGLNG